jgi:hypothetical protein
MKRIRLPDNAPQEKDRQQVPAALCWLLLGCLPVAVWFGMQLGAAPQIQSPIIKEALSREKLVTTEALTFTPGSPQTNRPSEVATQTAGRISVSTARDASISPHPESPVVKDDKISAKTEIMSPATQDQTQVSRESAPLRSLESRTPASKLAPIGQPTLIKPIVTLPTAEASRPKLPLVFQEYNPETLGLSERDVMDIETLQKNFTQEIGPQKAQDPDYGARWNNAQWTADAKLRALLGWRLFNAYQLQVRTAR